LPPGRDDARVRGSVQRQSGFFAQRASSGAVSTAVPGTAWPPARRRSRSVALALIGVAAVGGFAAEQWARDRCDPQLDPQCQRSYRWSGSGYHYRSYGWGWGSSTGSSTAASGPAARTGASTTVRGGFGSTGHAFAHGG